MNRLTSATDPLSYVTTYSYDAASNLTGVTNALGYTTTYAVDAASRQTAVTIPLTSSTSATTTYTLDAAGEVTSVKDPLSRVTTYTYTSRGWLASVKNPLGDVTSYSYDALGDETGMTQTDTHSTSVVTTMTYLDDTGLAQTTTDPLSYVTTYSYDANYRLTYVNENSQGIQNVTYTYDALDRLVARDNDGGTTTYGYDSAGNVTSVTDPLSNTSTYSYDGQGRQLTAKDPLSHTTTSAYNLAGWLTAVTDADSNTTTYAYNADGWLTATTNPNSYTATYSYDAIGELTSVTDFNGRQTTYSYNRVGWRTGETWVSGSYAATYSYDNAGEMTAAADSNSTYTFTYYSNGQVHQSAVSYPGLASMGTVTLTYSYDGFGNRTGLTDNAGSGATTTYTYNNDFQLASQDFKTGSTNADLSFTYDSSTDAVSTITMTGGSDTLTAGYSYGTNTIGIVYADSTTTFASFNYTLNTAGQVTTYTGPAGSSGFTNGTLTYAYDGDGQLTGVTGAETYTYGFDGTGNRNTTGYTTSTGNEMTAAPTPGSSTLTQYAYDHNGNLTSVTDSAGDVWTYTWDYRDRLTQVVEKSGATTLLNEQLTYDVFDDLIGVAVSTGSTTPAHWTVYDGKNPYIDFNSSGTLTTRYLTNPQGIDLLYGRVSSGGAVAWYFTDLEGSIREIVNQGGTVLDQVNYDPFGNVLYESTPANGDRFKFQGGEFDANLNLYRFGKRWNDPLNGRWISQDPLGFAAGDANLYRFIDNDPVNFIDPLGESASVIGLLNGLVPNLMALPPGRVSGVDFYPWTDHPRPPQMVQVLVVSQNSSLFVPVRPSGLPVPSDANPLIAYMPGLWGQPLNGSVIISGPTPLNFELQQALIPHQQDFGGPRIVQRIVNLFGATSGPGIGVGQDSATPPFQPVDPFSGNPWLDVSASQAQTTYSRSGNPYQWVVFPISAYWTTPLGPK
jgi:RHS repeat-associated protein